MKEIEKAGLHMKDIRFVDIEEEILYLPTYRGIFKVIRLKRMTEEGRFDVMTSGGFFECGVGTFLYCKCRKGRERI